MSKNKVVCINDDGWVEDKKYLWGLFTRTRDARGPKVDDVVTVLKEYYDEGVRFYQLMEWPFDKEGGYQADCFVPIQENFESISYSKVMEKESSAISVN